MIHMEFMGIPLKGSSKEFFSLLRNNTRIYSVEKEENDKVECTLLFTNRMAYVRIWGDPVYSVEVSFRGYSVVLEPTEEEWGNMVRDFNEYKEALTLKYGCPIFVETQLERKNEISYLDKSLSLYDKDYVPTKNRYISDNDGLSCRAKFHAVGGHISIFTTIGGMFEKRTALYICYTDEYNEEYNKKNPKSKPLDKKYNDL